MPKRLKPRERLTYANVMATVAVFIAIGSGAYAATQLPKNSVGPRQLKKNAVKTGKIARNAVRVGKLAKEAVKAGKLAKNSVATNRLRNDAVTGAKVKESTLGSVPTADAANIAGSLTPPEGWHEVGAPGEPGFLNSWKSDGSGVGETAGFYKDHEDIVHLKGRVTGGTSEVVFMLPPGYRPASGKILLVPVVCFGAPCTSSLFFASISGSAAPPSDGAVQASGETVVLDGISFRAEA
jgi:hypothetical protein